MNMLLLFAVGFFFLFNKKTTYGDGVTSIYVQQQSHSKKKKKGFTKYMRSADMTCYNRIKYACDYGKK